MQVLHAQATVLMRYTSQIKTSSKSFRQHVGHAYSHRSRHASPHQITALTPRQRVLDEQIVSGGPQATAQAGFSPAVAGEKAR
jgi:hypothetical protein